MRDDDAIVGLSFPGATLRLPWFFRMTDTREIKEAWKIELVAGYGHTLTLLVIIKETEKIPHTGDKASLDRCG